MKTKIKILFTMFMIIGFVVLFQGSTNAANAKISVSNTNPKPGEKVTVTAKVTAGAYNLTLSGNGKSETIYGYTNVNGNKSDSKSITFTAGSSGQKYTFSLSGDMTDINADKAENVKKTTSITVAKNTTPTQNNNAAATQNQNSNSTTSNNNSKTNNSNQDKEPTFQNVNQSAIVTEKVNFRSSYSTTSSLLGKIPKNATVNRIGIGNNGWSKIQYNDKTGYIKTEYLSNISELEEATEGEEDEEEISFGLEILKIKNLKLSPEFSTEIYEYTIDATEEIKQLDIENAIANTKTAKINITGNENFKPGKNIVKINVSDEETQSSVVYQIIVNIPNTKTASEDIDSRILDEELDRIQKEINLKNWIIRGIIVFVTVVIIIMFILRYKTVKSENMPQQYGKKDGYVIIDEKFDSLQNDREKIAKIEQFDEELEKNKEKEIEPPVQPKRMKKNKGKHF